MGILLGLPAVIISAIVCQFDEIPVQMFFFTKVAILFEKPKTLDLKLKVYIGNNHTFAKKLNL
jgi:hypothetical protein